jgi:hypothetical protein
MRVSVDRFILTVGNYQLWGIRFSQHFLFGIRSKAFPPWFPGWGVSSRACFNCLTYPKLLNVRRAWRCSLDFYLPPLNSLCEKGIMN